MHGQRTSASCARRFPMCVHQARPRRTCAFLHPTSGVHIRDAFAATTIPPAPARAGGVQKTATKAQFNRNDKCPKLWSKPEPNPGRVHATVTTVTLRRCLLRVCDPGEFGVYLLIHHVTLSSTMAMGVLHITVHSSKGSLVLVYSPHEGSNAHKCDCFLSYPP